MSAVFSFIIFFLTAALVKFKLYSVQVVYLGFALLFCIAAVIFLKKTSPRILKILSVSLGVLWASALLFYAGIFLLSALSSPYSGGEMKTDFFKGHSVMIIVPHEDDEVNLAGGVIEEYVAAGSEVRVVYATNGDRWAEGWVRIGEAAEAMKRCGIPDENLIFLGYGDMWRGQTYSDGSYSGHIYNAKDGAQWTSLKNQGTDMKSYSETYGTKEHPPYRQHEYSRANYLSDIRDVILEYRPDVLYVSDFDDHADHRGLSLFFEEAMGQILKDNNDYKPTVYKGFCYATAWESYDDYDESENVLSTRRPESSILLYDWDERLRVPVSCGSLGHSIRRAGLFRVLTAFDSQDGGNAAYRVINGDRQFFERRTDSLLYSSEFSFGNKELTKLNDFKLMDSEDVIERDRLSAGTVEVREGSRIAVLMKEPADIYEIALSEDPDPDNNILDCHIEWNDGSSTIVGPLRKAGGQTFTVCAREKVYSFTIVIDSVTGEGAGLTEVEAFSDHRELNTPQFIKLMDKDGNFLYDATVERGEQGIDLSVYGTDIPEFTIEGDEECTLRPDESGESVYVNVPVGKSCRVTASAGPLSDTVRVSNPGSFTRSRRDLTRRAEAFVIKKEGFLAKRVRYYDSVWRAVRVKLRGE